MILYRNKATKNKAFTLTEILLAVAIVGVIAALVIPATISKFRSEVLESGFKRQEEAINTAIDLLVVKENKSDFGETSMYSDGSKSIEDSAGKFLKRYLRVSKYYGDATSNKALIKKECFADKYYQIADNTKKEINLDDYLVGACAKLKSGASICLSPQISTTSAWQGVMDINGQKGPNIFGKALRQIPLEPKFVAFATRENTIGTGDPSTEVATQEDPDLDGEQYDCANDYSTACCAIHKAAGAITSPSHGCCSNTAVASTIPACAKNITMELNFYSSGTSTTACVLTEASCKPALWGSGTWAKQDGKGSELTVLETPPNISLYCGGKLVGNMSGGTLKNAIVNNSGTYYFTITNKNTGATCYHQSGSGLTSTNSSMVFTSTNGSTATSGGINWTLKYR